MNEQEINELKERIEALEKNNAALEDKFVSLKSQVDTITKFVSAITESQSIETAMNEIESVTKQLTECDNATFYCYDNSGDKFFAHGDYRDWQDNQSAEELKQAFVAQKIQKKGNSAIIPLVTSKGKSMGVIVAEKAAGFKSKDFESFKKDGQMMSTVELALKKEFEHQGRITDELTQIKNRQGLYEYVSNTVCGNLNDGKPVSILMCDIDHFKSINDTYGHDAGDKILRAVAAVLDEYTRDGADCAFRFGGEEMICILNCPPEKAVDIAERLRAEIEKAAHTVTLDGKPAQISVTVSIGVSELKPEREMTPANAKYVFDKELKKADNALYEAKESGRNKVVAPDNIFKQYLAYKVAELFCGDNRDSIAKLQEQISNYLENGGKSGYDDVREALFNYAESDHSDTAAAYRLMGLIEKKYGQDEPAPDQPPANRFFPKRKENPAPDVPAEENKGPKYYNKAQYDSIQNKEYLHVTAAVASKLSKIASEHNVQFSIKYNGDKSVFTVDGIKNRDFVEMALGIIKRENAARSQQTQENAPYPNIPQQDDYGMPPDYQQYGQPPADFGVPPTSYGAPQPDFPNVAPVQQEKPKKGVDFINKEGFKGIQNKTYIETDSKTAREIAAAAFNFGVEVSAKLDGNKSAVTVDGVTHRGFIETVKSMSAWADKVQITAAKSREQEQQRRGSGAR